MTICRVSDCSRPVWCKKRALCHHHYRRRQEGRRLEGPLYYSPRTCQHGNCQNPHFGGGLCKLHHTRKRTGVPLDHPFRRRRTSPADGICAMRRCPNPYFSGGLCRGHYTRKYRGLTGWELTRPVGKRGQRPKPASYTPPKVPKDCRPNMLDILEPPSPLGRIMGERAHD